MNEFIGSQNPQLDILHDFLAASQNEMITQFICHFVRKKNYYIIIMVDSPDVRSSREAEIYA